MNFESTVVSALIYVALPIIALTLLVCWLIYASRGRRAVQIAFKGFGVSVDIASSSGSAAVPDPEP